MLVEIEGERGELGVNMERERKEKGEKREKAHISSGGSGGTYVDLGHGNVDQTAQHDYKIETIPGVAKVIL